jgi:polysaccharide pyruvyl transferase WcaK-like protein
VRKCKVYLKGAYGPGNLGDDVLMVSIINVLKERFEAKDIVVGVEYPDLAKNFDTEIQWVHYKIPYQTEFVVYGGGGQFFAFKGADNQSSDSSDHGFFYKLKNFVKNNPNLLHAIQRLRASKLDAIDNLIVAKNVASYCIGLGPFEVKGKGVNRLKQFIQQVDYCSLRDNTSAEHYLHFGGDSNKLSIFKDPSFHSPDWFSDNHKERIFNGDTVSFILRDWPYSGHGQELIRTMAKYAKLLESKGEKVRMVSLFKDKDQCVIKQYPEFDWLIYDIEKHSIESFMQDLIYKSKYICSSRAHGVWLPTILGFPVMAVGIENKLVEVQKGLSKCSTITTAKTITEYDVDFNDYCRRFDSLKQNIDEQVSQNAKQAILARSTFLSWVDSCNGN